MTPKSETSRSDRRLLRAMTKYHETEDPAWVARMRGPRQRVSSGMSRRVSRRVSRRSSRTARVVALGLAGTTAIIVGATTNTFPVIFLGVVALMVGACTHVTARRG